MNSKRVDSVQTYRGLAFLCIFLSHVPLISTGPMGVSMFIVLSGFLMSLSYDGRADRLPDGVGRCIRFGYTKVKKLYPLHLITLLMMAVYKALSLWRNSFPLVEVKNAMIVFPFHIAMLQAWLPNSEMYFSFNKVSWYLSVCVFTYAIFPPLFRRVKKMNGKRLLLAGGGILLLQISISAAAALFTDGDGEWIKWVTYICPAYRALDFCQGVILGQLAVKRSGKIGKQWQMTLWEGLYAAAFVIWVALYIKGKVPDVIRYDIFWMPVSLAGAYLFYAKGGLITKALTNKLTVALGNISGQAFLIHQMVIGVVVMIVPELWLAAVCALAVTIAASAIYAKAESAMLNHIGLLWRKKKGGDQ